MPPRRRRPGPTPDEAVRAAVEASLVYIRSLETPAERARAATDLVARFEDARREVALARVDDVRQMLAAGQTLRATALALDLSVNAVVQIRDEQVPPPPRRRS